VSGLARIVAAALAGAVLMGQTAQAHHSFAVFFNADQDVVSITGPVSEFHFTNPHGIIKLTVTKGGAAQEWKVETNSPSILTRRGWTRDSLKLGEVLTIQGWPARDGTNYMRLRNALRADGTPIGMPLQ
jgi:hypothetical protein